MALFPGLGEAVLAEDVPGLADGVFGGAAVGGESGDQVAQRLTSAGNPGCRCGRPDVCTPP